MLKFSLKLADVLQKKCTNTLSICNKIRVFYRSLLGVLPDVFLDNIRSLSLRIALCF